MPETGDMMHGFVDYSLETYCTKLREVLAAFGHELRDFQLPDNPTSAIELIKQGFTFEFMKSALIRPVLLLKSRTKLLKWWKKVESGEDPPLPPVTKIFKSEAFANFIFLYFKIATEINVFSSLAQSLLILVKESLLCDKNQFNEVDENDCEDLSEEEDSDDDDADDDKSDEISNKIDVLANNNIDNSSKFNQMIVDDIVEDIVNSAFTKVSSKLPKTVTSLYGKTYVLKQSIQSL